MRLYTLFSGSSGNCALVSDGETRILIDAGVSRTRICAALSGLGLSPHDLDGVFITHEHSDHICGLPILVKRCGTPVFAPRSVAARLCGMYPELEGAVGAIHTGESIYFGELGVTAFPTSHDTPESVGYRIEGRGGAVGVCTDLGEVTPAVREALCGVDAALIETNHDEELLRYGPYPVYLKRRILSSHGHLSNEAGAELAAYLTANGARGLILGHLSRENNRPELAREAVERALDLAGASAELEVAPPSGTVELEVRARCSV